MSFHPLVSLWYQWSTIQGPESLRHQLSLQVQRLAMEELENPQVRESQPKVDIQRLFSTGLA